MVREHMTIQDVEDKLVQEQRDVYAEGFKPYILMIALVWLFSKGLFRVVMINIGFVAAVYVLVLFASFWAWRTFVVGKRLKQYVGRKFDAAVDKLEQQLQHEEDVAIKGGE
ncbi:MAG: hypothetical protein M0024_10590 [Nitrospiraceae bacterium]|nr:hypothetical protein [Nitrospiraceae bacterium]